MSRRLVWAVVVFVGGAVVEGMAVGSGRSF